MNFLRRQMFLIICGAAGAVGIALAVTGMGAMPKVVQDLDAVAKLYNELGSMQSKPANQRMIDEQQKRIDLVLEDRAKVFEEAKKLYRWEPLVPDVFPDGSPEARRQFRVAYGKAMQELWDSLKAGRPATDADVAAMKDRIEEEEYKRTALGVDPGANDPPEEITPAGVLTKSGIRRNPVARAALAAAQRVYCYGVAVEDAKPPDTEPSLFFEPSMRDTSTAEAPSLKDCWRAQIRYWITKDVVEAIVAVNEEAAAAARDKGQERWVGIMPVKDVISVRTSKGYVVASEDVFAGAAPGGDKPALPPAAPKTAFTHSACNDTFEVMQFTVKLVMDQRDVLRFVDRLCGTTFHTPLRIAYKAIEPNREMKGKIYGSEPAVNVVMDFETIMLGEVFRPMIPAEVCEEFNIPCEGKAARPKKGEEEEGG